MGVVKSCRFTVRNTMYIQPDRDAFLRGCHPGGVGEGGLIDNRPGAQYSCGF